MNRKLQRFLATWATVSVALATLVTIFNVMMDPYLIFGMPRITGINARKPAVNTQQRSMKARDVLHARPNTLLLGSSRVALGLDAQHPAWPAHARPVYNLAVAGGSPYIAYRYLQHVASHHRPALVLLGLDFEYFLAPQNADRPAQAEPAQDEFESRLAITREGIPTPSLRWQHLRDQFQAAFSLESLVDSSETLTANVSGKSFDLVAGNWELADNERFFDQPPYVGMMSMNLLTIRVYLKSKPTSLVMADVRAILDLCQSNGVRVVLLINPVHADDLEILALLGQWPAFEDWKRELVALTEQYPGKNGDSRVPLWDFSDYSAYSTEDVLIGGDALRWFYDSVHYNRKLGDLMVRRILDMDEPNFGVRLDSANVESHLVVIREHQRVYREHHPEAERRVRHLYRWAAGTQPHVPQAVD